MTELTGKTFAAAGRAKKIAIRSNRAIYQGPS